MPRVENDSMMSTLIDELVRRWNAVKMRNTRFNPIEIILSESIEFASLLPFVRDEFNILLTTAPSGWGIESVRRMIRFSSLAAYRFITLHIPVDSIDLFQDDLRLRVSQLVDSSRDSTETRSEPVTRLIDSTTPRETRDSHDVPVASSQTIEQPATSSNSNLDTVNISFRHRKNIK